MSKQYLICYRRNYESTDMVDQITENLYHSLIRSFPPTSSYSLADLASRGLRRNIFQYLSFTLEERATREVEALSRPESSWFDFSEEDVKQRWTDYAVALKKHPVFPADNWASELQGATEAVVRYILTPVAGLEHILFSDQDSIRTSVVAIRLGRLLDHDHIRKAVVEAASESDSTTLTADQFRPMLLRHLAISDSRHDLSEVVKPVTALVRDAIDTDAIPVTILTAFYDDIGLRDIADRLHSHADRYNLTTMNVDQLNDGLSLPRSRAEAHSSEETIKTTSETNREVDSEIVDFISDTAEVVASDMQSTEPVSGTELPLRDETSHEPMVVADSTSVEKTVALNQHPAETDSAPEPAPADIEDPDKPAPRWKAFQQKLNAPLTENPRRFKGTQSKPDPSSSKHMSAEGTAKSSRNGGENLDMFSEYTSAESPTVPIWERFRARNTRGTSPADFGAAELRVLGETVLHRRDEFIGQLFDSSAEEYHDVVVELDSIKDWDSASHYIAENVFRKYRVNIYCELAVSFTNAVEQRYRAIQSE